jgi:hypothetical protein
LQCQRVKNRVARFFAIKLYQKGRNIPNALTICQTAMIYSISPKFYHQISFQGPLKFT